MNVHGKLNTIVVTCFCPQSTQVNRMSADFLVTDGRGCGQRDLRGHESVKNLKPVVKGKFGLSRWHSDKKKNLPVNAGDERWV